MKIKKVIINNRKKCLEITVDKKKNILEFPFMRLRTRPRRHSLVKALIDPELASEVIVYSLSNGAQDILTLDEILDYNQDAEYRRQKHLYELTVTAHEILDKTKQAHRAIIRRMNSSPTQFYRLLDTTNYSKTIDQMVKLLEALDHEVGFQIYKRAA